MLYKCPKSDKCVMDCPHKKPHEHDSKYCDGNNDDPNECPKCVPEMMYDVTFFKEDFEL